MDILSIGKDAWDRYRDHKSHKHEINKFRDNRRVEIYSTVVLSDEQKSDIDKLYLENYGEKIPYTWHRHFTAFTGKFDPAYLPELLYIPEFEKYMNLWPQYVRTFTDKNVLPMLAKAVGVKTPDYIVSCTKGLFRDSNYCVISQDTVENKLQSSVGGGIL